MSTDSRFTFSETDLPAAILGLRRALGRSQEVMAQLLGCSLPALQKWEMGTAIPAGEWLIRMLQICPDEETRNAFRIRAERRAAPREPSGSRLKRVGRMDQTRREELREMAHQAVDTLFECGKSGLDAADSRLEDFAENLEGAANYFAGHAPKTDN
jgi:transcriptional regulator with XRE-family HTH domain